MNSSNPIAPPRWPLRLLRRVLNPNYLEELEGDMAEQFQDNVKKHGLLRARRRYIWGAVLLLRPALVKKLSGHVRLNQYGMLKHNFVMTMRGFQRYKTSFLINIVGLSTGLASVIMIYLWVSDELGVDRFHEKDSQLYQVLLNVKTTQGILTESFTPAPLASALLEGMPEVEYAVSVNDFFTWRSREGVFSYGEQQIAAKGWHASKDFFQVFSYELVQGDKNEVLGD
ncbi:MAG: permease prefix domain 2-containing transporter, partial [Bacteroidota bacterium]